MRLCTFAQRLTNLPDMTIEDICKLYLDTAYTCAGEGRDTETLRALGNLKILMPEVADRHADNVIATYKPKHVSFKKIVFDREKHEEKKDFKIPW